MSDASLGTLGFDVNVTGLRAGSDELTRFETRINVATAALERMEARAAAAFAKGYGLNCRGRSVSAWKAATTAFLMSLLRKNPPRSSHLNPKIGSLFFGKIV